jgi:hypothetical protein
MSDPEDQNTSAYTINQRKIVICAIVNKTLALLTLVFFVIQQSKHKWRREWDLNPRTE